MSASFATFFEQSPIGAFRTDLDGRLLLANAALQRTLGLGSEPEVLAAMNGRADGWYTEPGRRSVFRARLAADGQVSDFVSSFIRPGTGETLVVREHAWTVRDPQGRPQHLEGTLEDITGSHQAKAALQMTLDNAGRGIMRLDANGRVVLYNRHVLLLLELPDPVLACHPLLGDVIRFQEERGDFGAGNALLSPGQLSGFEHDRRNAIRDSLSTASHYLRRTRSGRVLEISTQPLDDGGVVRTYSDVTDYVRAQEALADKTQALRATLDNMDQGICAMDAAGRTVMFNRRYQELLGFPDELLATQPTIEQLVQFQAARGDFGANYEFVDPGAREYVRQGDKLPPLTGPQSYVRKTHDGRTLEVNTRALPGGGSIRTFSDITVRLQAQQALAHKQAQLAALVNNLPDRVWLKDTAGVYVLSNPAHQKFIGLPEDRIVGWTSDQLFGPEMGALHAASDARAIAATGPLLQEEEVGGPTPGSRLHVEVVKVGMRDDVGRPIGLLGIARDITARKQAESALVQARDVAQAGERAKAEFLANMSHEIRTPMNAVIGMGDLLAATPLSTTQQAYVHAIRSSGATLLRLINDILDFSKAEAGKLELEHTPLDLRQCIAEAVDFSRTAASNKGLTLGIVVDAQVPTMVLGDAARLRQVLVNLVSNAVKFTAHGQVRVSACLRPLADGRDGLQLAVRDTGIGIPVDRMDRLFHSFSQVDASTTRRYGGTGLGLAICKSLVGLMGGTIQVQSQAGVGSEFMVELPFEPASLPLEPAAVAPSKPMPMEQASECPLRVLLAEDNEINQMVAEHMLQSLGYHVTIVEHGQLALDAVDRAQRDGKPFDVVLMDVQMPVLDGLEATRRLCLAHPSLARRPWVVAMTANAMDGDRAQCLAAGMDDYLSKPIHAADVAAALRKAFRALAARRT